MHKYNEIAVKWFFVGFITFFVFASAVFSGCSSPLQQLSGDQLAALPADRIAALRDAGQVIRACLQLNGPPPAGSGTLLILPATDTAPINFSSDCHPLPPPVVVQVPAKP